MPSETALNAIAGNPAIFAAENLSRLEPGKLKSLRLPAKLAYFHGASNYHRVAVVCPLVKGISHEQELIAGLLWANRVSNGQKTVLYLVGEGFAPQLNRLIQLFGPQIEVRLVYYSSRLSTPLLVMSRESRVAPPHYSVPLPREQEYWERKLNPVEKGWFQWALNYFGSYLGEELEVCVLENWVGVKYRGLELVRISKKESRLCIALTTRFPREVAGMVGAKEEKEGWFNAQGRLNSEFVQAFEQRLAQLRNDRELFARVCPEKQRLEYEIRVRLADWGLGRPVHHQLDVSYKSETSLQIDVAGRSQEGNLVVITVHPQKDLQGYIHSLEQLVWAKIQLPVISQTYFNGGFLAEPRTWLVCPQNRVHPDLEVLRCLMWPGDKVQLITVNDDWADAGVHKTKVVD